MSPYYSQDGLTIYHGSSLEILPTFGDQVFDLVLTDPPYGVGVEYGAFEDTQENLWKLVEDIFPEMRRVAKRIALTPGKLNQYRYPIPTWCLAWFHGGGGTSSCWGFDNWQPILVYGKDPYLEVGKGGRPDALMKTEAIKKYGHPCPKPLGFWSWLLNRCSVSGGIVDPFMGSGTTLVAAKHLGREAVGIELEERYCEVAAKRLSQMELFGGDE